MPDMRDIWAAMMGGQTPATQAASQQFQARDPSQDKIGQFVTPQNAIGNVMTALQALHPDQPRTLNGITALGGMAMPWGGPTKTPPEQLEANINNRNLVYHATDPDAAEAIAHSGEIRPGLYGNGPSNTGVSVSRVPRVASKEQKAVTFSIDNTKVPPSFPWTEPDYEKTAYVTNNHDTGPQEYNNPKFEFENRTKGDSIPTSAIKEMMVDTSVLSGVPYSKSKAPTYGHWLQDAGMQERKDQLQATADKIGVPIRYFKNGRDLHSYRAKMSQGSK